MKALWATLWVLAWLLMAGEARAEAGSCTDGTDCLCDCLAHTTAGMPAGCADYGITTGPTANILHCDDFEALTLHGGNATTAPGGAGGVAPGLTPSGNCNDGSDGSNHYTCTGAPLYGPWYDPTPIVTNPYVRGRNSYWKHIYGQQGINSPVLWHHGEPSPAVWGATCDTSVSGGTPDCDGPQEWSATGESAPYAGIDIMRDGEFDDEHASTPAEPACIAPMTCEGAFDGRQIMAYRIPRGDNDLGTTRDSEGFVGYVPLPGQNYTTLGFTQALAFPSDSVASGIWDQAWKTTEYQTSSGSGAEQPWMGNVTNGFGPGECAESRRPFCAFKFITGNVACEAAKAGATISVGNVYCGNASVNLYANYDNTTNAWTYGKWGCIQGYISGMGTSNMELFIKLNGTEIFHMTGWNSASADLMQDYDSIGLNAYANANQDLTGGTSYATYRFEDNTVWTSGLPISCEMAGFNLTGGPPQPDRGDLSFTVSNDTVAEGAGTKSIDVTRSNGADGAVTVTVSSTGGTATSGTDYTALAEVLSWADQETGAKTATLTITSDTLDENSETVTLSLGSVTGGASLTPINVETLTITDDDSPPTVTLSIAPSPMPEAGPTSNVVASLSTPSGLPVTVTVGYTGTATGGGVDYTASSTSIVIPAGSVNAVATLTPVQDTLDEVNETIIVDILTVTNGTESGTQQSTVNITDDDAAAALSINNVIVTESNTGSVNANFSVSLTPVSGKTVTVSVVTSNDTATAGVDYTATGPTTLTFSPGETAEAFTVPVLGDTTDEDDESYFVTLSSPTNATISDTTGVGTITDDDTANAGTIAFTSSTYSVSEGSVSVNIRTIRASAFAGAVGAQVTSSNGTATAGVDYTAVDEAVAYIDTVGGYDIVTISILPDTDDEPNETVTLTLHDPTGGVSLTGPTTATLTIVDDDDAPTPSNNRMHGSKLHGNATLR